MFQSNTFIWCKHYFTKHVTYLVSAVHKIWKSSEVRIFVKILHVSSKMEVRLFAFINLYFTYYRVTIVKDKDTRRSKGVAFVLFLDRESARNCVRAINNKQVRMVYSQALSSKITGILRKTCHLFSSLKSTFPLSCLGEQLRQASLSTTDGRLSSSGGETTQTNLNATNVGYAHVYPLKLSKFFDAGK